MAERILYQGKLCSIVCDDDHDVVRFIDHDHVLYIIERDAVEMVLKDDKFYYRILPNKEPVTSFYYSEETEQAKCAMIRMLS
jgi:hypothetical protein